MWSCLKTPVTAKIGIQSKRYFCELLFLNEISTRFAYTSKHSFSCYWIIAVRVSFSLLSNRVNRPGNSFTICPHFHTTLVGPQWIASPPCASALLVVLWNFPAAKISWTSLSIQYLAGILPWECQNSSPELQKQHSISLKEEVVSLVLHASSSSCFLHVDMSMSPRLLLLEIEVVATSDNNASLRTKRLSLIWAGRKCTPFEYRYESLSIASLKACKSSSVNHHSLRIRPHLKRLSPIFTVVYPFRPIQG